jgi:hypothetical protein
MNFMLAARERTLEDVGRGFRRVLRVGAMSARNIVPAVVADALIPCRPQAYNAQTVQRPRWPEFVCPMPGSANRRTSPALLCRHLVAVFAVATISSLGWAGVTLRGEGK